MFASIPVVAMYLDIGQKICRNLLEIHWKKKERFAEPPPKEMVNEAEIFYT